MTSEWMERKSVWNQCGKDYIETSMRKFGHHRKDEYIRGCTQREAEVDERAVQSNNELFKRLTTSGRTEQIDPTKEKES